MTQIATAPKGRRGIHESEMYVKRGVVASFGVVIEKVFVKDEFYTVGIKVDYELSSDKHSENDNKIFIFKIR